MKIQYTPTEMRFSVEDLTQFPVDRCRDKVEYHLSCLECWKNMWRNPTKLVTNLRSELLNWSRKNFKNFVIKSCQKQSQEIRSFNQLFHFFGKTIHSNWINSVTPKSNFWCTTSNLHLKNYPMKFAKILVNLA